MVAHLPLDTNLAYTTLQGLAHIGRQLGDRVNFCIEGGAGFYRHDSSKPQEHPQRKSDVGTVVKTRYRT